MSQLTVFASDNPAQPLLQTANSSEIQRELNNAGVRFEQWRATAPLGADSSVEQIKAAYAADIAKLQAEGGYITVDVISLSASHPDKAALRQKFLAEHTHSEDEVRFFVRGQGLFCLHIAGKVYQVLCQQNDLISVPANTPHWFDMGSEPEFSAIRLFNNVEGWVAKFTGNALASHFPLLP
ncbi:1,2-dihydroxy-3-keto-5-methylthiopentene dioxygenase [Rheinheimera gaetbuli]